MSATAQVFDPFLLNVMGMPQAIKRATLYPYAVRVRYQLPADAAELRGFVDYDPIFEDDAVQSWLRPGRYCGD